MWHSVDTLNLCIVICVCAVFSVTPSEPVSYFSGVITSCNSVDSSAYLAILYSAASVLSRMFLGVLHPPIVQIYPLLCTYTPYCANIPPIVHIYIPPYCANISPYCANIPPIVQIYPPIVQIYPLIVQIYPPIVQIYLPIVQIYPPISIPEAGLETSAADSAPPAPPISKFWREHC